MSLRSKLWSRDNAVSREASRWGEGMARARPGRRARDLRHAVPRRAARLVDTVWGWNRNRPSPIVRMRTARTPMSPTRTTCPSLGVGGRRQAEALERRKLLLGLGAFMLVLCLAGGIGGYIWYDRATRIDRSTPAIVVEQFV